VSVSTDIDPESPADLDPLVAAALRENLTLLETGTPAARLNWVQRHAELMPQLECYLDGLRLIQEFSPPLRIAAAEIQDDISPDWHTQPIGDFQLLRRIGRGGMGVVYEAEQLSLRRKVAVKLLPFSGAFDSTLQQRFQRESQAAARLHHPHIVPVFTVGCERGLHYYVMQLIHGRSIAALIEELRLSQSNSALPNSISDPAWFRRVARFGIQAAEGLQYAHEMGIIHRDIKPANLLLDERDELFVSDFGLASTQECVELTVSGHMTGTLRYASPEQVLGKRAGVDRRTDIYSLGATLYELLTLSPPFPSDDRRSLTHDILHTAPLPPRQINPSIPRDLETVILRAMAGEQQDRYASASDLALDLQRFQEGHAVHARRPGSLYHTSLRGKKETWSGLWAEGVPGERKAVEALKSGPEGLWAGFGFGAIDVATECRDHSNQVV
jgi:serine/threonine protein kinase